MASIELKGKILECGSLVGFNITLQNGKSSKTTNITKENLKQLIEKGVPILYDAAGVIDGNLFIKEEVLSSLKEVKNHYTIKDRVKDDFGRVVGYNIVDTESNAEHTVELNTAWKMAADNLIEKARAVVIKTTGKKLVLITCDK